MRKEVLFALLFGSIFGLVIAFGVWRLNSSFSSKSQASSDESPTPIPTGTIGLTISKPNDLSVIRESTVTIEGASKQNSWLVASGEERDSVIQTKEGGAFGVDVDLIGGINQLVLTSFDQSGETFEKSLLIVYSSQFPSPPDDTEGRIKEAQNPPTAYIGTITDIVESTIHLKNSSDEINQISTQDDTAYANDVTKKEIKYNDLAIGDFVVAMGYRNGNHVLKAKRIVVSATLKSVDRKFHIGKVKGIKNKVLTLTKKDGEVALTFPKTWKGPDIDEIDEDAQVIAVSNSEGNNPIRTIQIIK